MVNLIVKCSRKCCEPQWRVSGWLACWVPDPPGTQRRHAAGAGRVVQPGNETCYGWCDFFGGDPLFSRVSAVLLFATAISTVAAAQENCRAIQDPKTRLECFDKLPAAPPAANTAPRKNEPAAPKASPNTTFDGDWQLRQHKDTMTDKLTCVVLATARPYIQFSIGQLYISYAGRGGVDGYTYRIRRPCRFRNAIA